MNNLNVIPALAALILLGASCSEKTGPGQGEETEQPTEETVTLSLTSTFGSKTVLGELEDGVYRVYWSDGDRICVNGTKSSTLYGIAPGTGTAEFTVENVHAPYHIVYPSIICASMDGDGVAAVNLPVAQTYREGSFAEGSAILYGKSEKEGCELHNLCGVVRIPVIKGRFGDRLSSLTISSVSTSRPLAGEFLLDTKDGNLTPVKGSGTLMLSLPSEGLELTDGNPVLLYVSIPAGEYPDGFVITLGNNEGTMLCDWTADTDIPAGKMATLPEITFTPDATKLIDSVDSWNEFAAAVNSGDQDLIDRWVDPDTGVASLAADISYGGDLTQIEEWNYIFNGNGHSIGRANATEALFLLIGTEGAVRNLVLEGKRVAQSSNSDRGTGNLAAFSRGLVEGCTNGMDIELSGMDKNILIAGLVTDNAGIIKDSKNLGNISLSMSITANRVVYGGGISCRAQRNLNSSTLYSGTFINCENAGNITIKRTSSGSFSLTKFAIGGIAGFVSQGTSSGVHSRFEGCTNSGNITVWQDAGHSASNYGYAVGGILGRCCETNETTDFYYKVGGASSSSYNGYYVEMVNCSNSGTIDVSLYSADGGTQMSGARQIYVGGIIGCLQSRYDDRSTISGCVSTGTLLTGHLTKADCTGGIVGGVGYSAIEGCSADLSVGLSKTSISLSEKNMGIAGGIAGYVFRDATVKDCTSVLTYDSSEAKSSIGAGFVGAAAKHNNLSANLENSGTATLTLVGENSFSGTLNGIPVTASNAVCPTNLGSVNGAVTIK
ncbi:MAG: hypothetical protein ACI395_04765 [Candidatus Cryptobacteroides sp.]